jgi:hypothetical protein
MGTENIKPGLFLRYPFQIAGPTFVDITNRYPIKRETPPLSVRNGASYSVISHPFV